MNKLPTKQIYLLVIIIVGIFTLSVYSTYSIFTLESETDSIVSMNTPNSILLGTETYEYKQVIVPKNSYIFTDIDLYNNTADDLCYGIWYKVISNNLINEEKIKIYENTNSSLTTSGVINTITSKRVNILIINDNDVDVKLNIGLSYEKNNESCSLNLSEGRLLISSTIDSPKILSDTLMKNIEVTNNEEGYLTYKNNTDILSVLKDIPIYVSTEFAYRGEIFTLTNPKEINYDDLRKYVSTENNNYYTCLDNDKCSKLYKINSVKEEISEEEKSISIDKYDILIGYLSGESGLKKLNNDYIYFGDNPHNFIYYNCKNELDINTCELWRIMGFYYDKASDKYLTKIIKDEPIGIYSYNENNNLWNDSLVANYLNKEYKFKNSSLLTEVTYKQENIITNESDTNIISYLPDENKSFVTIMNLTDYLNASVCENKNIFDYDNSCLKNNWLNKNNEVNEFTMTIKYEMPTTDSETGDLTTPENNIVYSVGNSIDESLITDELNIRPVVYLKARTMFTNGDGTTSNPYIIK